MQRDRADRFWSGARAIVSAASIRVAMPSKTAIVENGCFMIEPLDLFTQHEP
jgi:hypothetical protein